MEDRILFSKGKQRKFLDLAIKKLNCVSLRGLLQYGFNVSYSSLKNYYTERRLISRSLFESMCYLARIKRKIKIIKGNWGQVKGGKS
jgi:hypothetical protein